MIIQVFSNSIIFPCMELFLVIFQVFHDFQSLWEPCIIEPEHSNMHKLAHAPTACVSTQSDQSLMGSLWVAKGLQMRFC